MSNTDQNKKNKNSDPEICQELIISTTKIFIQMIENKSKNKSGLITFSGENSEFLKNSVSIAVNGNEKQRQIIIHYNLK